MLIINFEVQNLIVINFNFVNAVAVELPTGTKIYRVTGGNSAGGYWTIQKPNSVGDVIGGTAVQPAWNEL